MLYPADYVEEWGRKYGIGLGPVPVSEALTNQYDQPIAESDDFDRTMHPVGNCLSQIDCVDVTDEDYERDKAILAIDDVKLNHRGSIMRDLQLVKSRKLQSMCPEAVGPAIDRVNVRKGLKTQ